MWRRIMEEGSEWEVRVLADPEGEILEFRCLREQRQPRRMAIEPGDLEEMDEERLRAVFRRALPIGGDHYGRPGKRMPDGGGEPAV